MQANVLRLSGARAYIAVHPLPPHAHVPVPRLLYEQGTGLGGLGVDGECEVLFQVSGTSLALDSCLEGVRLVGEEGGGVENVGPVKEEADGIFRGLGDGLVVEQDLCEACGVGI